MVNMPRGWPLLVVLSAFVWPMSRLFTLTEPAPKMNVPVGVWLSMFTTSPRPRVNVSMFALAVPPVRSIVPVGVLPVSLTLYQPSVTSATLPGPVAP